MTGANQAMRAVTVLSAATLVGPVFAGDGHQHLAMDVVSGHVTCETTLGRAGAERLRDLCVGVSPATHPPCGTRNSCALIEDEIARSCAIIGDRVAARTPACTAEPTSAAAAVDVLRRFYAAIDARDFDTAYDMLRPDGGKGQDFDAFRRGFAATRSSRVTPGKPGAIEGAAGSSYVTIPVRVDAILDDGGRQHYRGRYVLRRVNGQGTPPDDDRRWHIFSAHLERQ